MRLISWNVNGMRAVHRKEILPSLIHEVSGDVYCFQETKGGPSDFPADLRHVEGYEAYWYPAQRKGYSGVVTYTRIKPEDVIYGIGHPEYDSEGRVLTLEFEDFYLINTYFPNSQHGLTRLDFKIDFDEKLLEFSEKLRKKKPVIICGDFNVAHEEIDIARPKDNEGNPGFTREEREWMTKFLEHGYIDTFRYLHPDEVKYTWWSYRTRARERNIGWRIDYFIVSEELKDRIKKAEILNDIMGSDHCPIELVVE